MISSRPVSRSVRVGVLFPAIALAISAPTSARAYQAEVDAQTIGQAYQLRGLSGSPVLSRRRVTQSLQLGVYDLGSPAEGGPQLLFRARMRIDADFGLEREEYTLQPGSSLDRYVPLLQPAPVEMMYGYLEGKRYAGGWLSFKLGRQYLVDPLGWYSFDGASFRVTTPAYFAVEAYGGWEVRGGIPFTTTPQIGRYELGGVVRTDRSGLPASAYPSIQPQSMAPAWGAAIETVGPHWIHGRLAYRKAYNTGAAFVAGGTGLGGPDQMGIYDRTRTSSERLGYGVTATFAELVGVRGNLIYDLYGARFSNVEAGVDWMAHKRVTLSADYTYFRPIFDADSIFNVFGFEPMDDVSGRVDLDLTDQLNLSADAMVRRYRSDDPDSALRGVPQVATHAAPGGGLRVRQRWATARMVLRGNALFGDQGRRVGADLSYEKTVAGRTFLDGRLSLWNFRDRLRTDGAGGSRDATSVGYVVGAGYKLSNESNAMLQWEHDVNRLVGMRYRVLATLNVRVWL